MKDYIKLAITQSRMYRLYKKLCAWQMSTSADYGKGAMRTSATNYIYAVFKKNPHFLQRGFLNLVELGRIELPTS